MVIIDPSVYKHNVDGNSKFLSNNKGEYMQNHR